MTRSKAQTAQSSEAAKAMPPTEQQRPGRALAVIVRTTTKEKGYIFARNVEASGEEFFVHTSSVAPELWPDLDDGDAITCRVSETSKGLRAYDVERATSAADLDKVAATEEHRGNK